jgi:hypothetical protein
LAAAQQAAPAASPLAAEVAKGHTVRLSTKRGPIHVWAPAGYRPESAALVVYVHGYYVNVDRAWSEHRLAEQFAKSGINAVFIAPEAPTGARPAVAWPSLGELVRVVFDQTTLTRPSGRVIAIGHSGAYRTLLPWLEDPLLDIVIALDAMYGEIEPFREWVSIGTARQLVMVGDDTIRWTEELARALPMLEIDQFPDGELPAEMAKARATYIRSQHGHMALVEDGVAIPQILRGLGIERLPKP